MTTRTTKRTVIFTRPFSLSGFDGEQPAGSYSVETDEELLDGVSFPAYRRLATMMQLDVNSVGPAGILQVAVIDPLQLDGGVGGRRGPHAGPKRVRRMARTERAGRRRLGTLTESRGTCHGQPFRAGRTMRAWLVPPVVARLFPRIMVAIVLAVRSLA